LKLEEHWIRASQKGNGLDRNEREQAGFDEPIEDLRRRSFFEGGHSQRPQALRCSTGKEWVVFGWQEKKKIVRLR
jgi:hypothetical protein